ncbi:diacylglycerol kinase family protein [Aciduricibacillus chroicocephali]|uniref:Diacylglycerol kinase family protein n=1 Tax=Aciduricibacillus chroicocephali TaxID=3054939 RepID=A0ABY9KRZ6_9BACI|nr:diacylglycerol kinase family protein [Bacillaceae bacterium 44XB]
MNDKKHGIGLFHAIKGIGSAFLSERNFRIHSIAAVFAIGAGFLLRINRLEWMILVVVIGLVLQAELLNTAAEKLIDYIKPEFHPVAGLVKDVAAGAVLIAALAAFAIGLLLFVPKLYDIFF